MYACPTPGATSDLSGGRSFDGFGGFDGAIVSITTKTGLKGWGEGVPFGASYIAAHAVGARAGIAEMAPHSLGRDPRARGVS